MSVFKQSESYRPFTYPWAAEAAKQHSIDMYWDVHQVELQDDIQQYMSKNGLATANMTHEENKAIIDKMLLSFSEQDKGVAEGYKKLIPYTKNNEILTWQLTAAHRETVHQRAYALAGETFGFTDSNWVAFQEYDEVREKLAAMTVDVDCSTNLGYAKQLFSVLSSEGVSLFGTFTPFLNLKRFGIMMGFNDINAWSLADETDHVENNIKTLDIVYEDLTDQEKQELEVFAKELITNLVKAEHTFTDWLGNKHEGLTNQEIKDYVSYLGESILYRCGFTTKKSVRSCPLEWMDAILSAGKHENFFEKRVVSYSHEKLEGVIDYSKYLSLIA